MSVSRSLVQMLQNALAARRASRSSSPKVGSREWVEDFDRRRRESGRTSEYDDIELIDDDLNVKTPPTPGTQAWKDAFDKRRRANGRTSEYDEIDIFDDIPKPDQRTKDRESPSADIDIFDDEPKPARGTSAKQKEHDEFELIGRGARGDRREWENVQANRRLVNSSNVYAFFYVPETKTQGILYVTFLYWQQGMKPGDRSGPGATYAYYDFPLAKYHQYSRASDQSAGAAVWDYCRQRGSRHGHQHRYMLVQAEGDYVPQKATAKGVAPRELIEPGYSKKVDRALPRSRRSTLSPPPKRLVNRGEPDRGEPDRAEPDNGQPNRG